jgi:hypothetical protein
MSNISWLPFSPVGWDTALPKLSEITKKRVHDIVRADGGNALFGFRSLFLILTGKRL